MQTRQAGDGWGGRIAAAENMLFALSVRCRRGIGGVAANHVGWPSHQPAGPTPAAPSRGGTIDEYRLYARRLTADEIKTLYEAGADK